MTDYTKKGHYYIEEPRFEMKELLPLLPQGATVLDIGAGNGNNTRLLLSKGFSVEAVEPNPEAIRALKQLQEQYRDTLNIVEGSLDTYQPAGKFDVVTCCMVVHFMEDHAAGIAAIKKVQSWTKPGGLNLMTGYMADQPLSEEYSFLFEPGELATVYKAWQICWQQETYRLTLARVYSVKDVIHILLGKRGYKAARIIARK